MALLLAASTMSSHLIDEPLFDDYPHLHVEVDYSDGIDGLDGFDGDVELDSESNEDEITISLKELMIEYFNAANGTCISCFDNRLVVFNDASYPDHPGDSKARQLLIGKVFCTKCETCIICNDHHLPQMKLCVSCFCSNCGHLKPDAHNKNVFFKNSEYCICNNNNNIHILSNNQSSVLDHGKSSQFPNSDGSNTMQQNMPLEEKTIYYCHNSIEDIILERTIALRQQQNDSMDDPPQLKNARGKTDSEVDYI
jgi:hypothetical protein